MGAFSQRPRGNWICRAPTSRAERRAYRREKARFQGLLTEKLGTSAKELDARDFRNPYFKSSPQVIQPYRVGALPASSGIIYSFRSQHPVCSGHMLFSPLSHKANEESQLLSLDGRSHCNPQRSSKMIKSVGLRSTFLLML